jgi:hypothetical protein
MHRGCADVIKRGERRSAVGSVAACDRVVFEHPKTVVSASRDAEVCFRMLPPITVDRVWVFGRSPIFALRAVRFGLVRSLRSGGDRENVVAIGGICERGFENGANGCICNVFVIPLFAYRVRPPSAVG